MTSVGEVLTAGAAAILGKEIKEDDWKSTIKIPPKDRRFKTAVSEGWMETAQNFPIGNWLTQFDGKILGRISLSLSENLRWKDGLWTNENQSINVISGCDWNEGRGIWGLLPVARPADGHLREGLGEALAYPGGLHRSRSFGWVTENQVMTVLEIRFEHF